VLSKKNISSAIDTSVKHSDIVYGILLIVIGIANISGSAVIYS